MTDWNLDDAVLESYIKRFYGQGSYAAKYWFVGMEFGGGKSVAEIVSRIQGWADRGRPEVEDLVGPDGDAGGSPWFQGRIPLQRTWAQLIRVVLSAEGPAPSTEQVRAYQKDRLGRQGGLDCILELLPLPSPGTGNWLFYSKYSRLPYLCDRRTYIRQVAPARSAHLHARIAEHRPGVVIFYGATYAYWWREIAGVEFQPSGIDKVSIAENGPTRFISMQHPAARPTPPNSYFDAVGRLIAARPLA